MALEHYQVLLVDDDEDDYVVTRDLLSEAAQVRFTIHWVDSYSAGLEAIRDDRYDVYLLDYRLGSNTGLELLQVALEAESTKPFILLTGMGSYEIDHQALASGASDYLIKGVQLTAPLLERTILHAIGRKQIEQSLRDSEARYRLLFQEANDLLLIHPLGTAEQPGFPFTDVNDAACQLLGYSREELCQLTPLDLIPGEEQAIVLAELSTLSDSRQLLFEKTLIAKDGMHIPIELHARVFDWHGTPTVLSVGRDVSDRKVAEARLRESQRRLSLATTAARQGIWDWNVMEDQLFWDDVMYDIYGLSPSEFAADYATWQACVHPDDLARVEADLQAAIAGEHDFLSEFRIFRPDGQICFLESQALTIRDASGQAIRMTGINRDISDRKQMELERDRFFNLALDLLFIADQHGIIKRINPAWNTVLGYTPNDLIGRSLWSLVHPDDQLNIANSQARLAEGHGINALEFRCQAEDGTSLWFAWNLVPFLQENLLYGTGRDISERKQSEFQLVYKTLHDELTGLYNRTYFIQRLEVLIKQVSRDSHYHYAVLFIDLDNFKDINDSLGHLIGDQLLNHIAQILSSSVRDVDTVARLGGDEFTILIENVSSLKNLLIVIDRIQASIEIPFEFEGQEIFTSASIGIVLSTKKYQSSAEIIRDADIAMYRAKANGKGCYEVFDQVMYAETRSAVELANDLRHAIEREELSLYYQPLVNLNAPYPIEGFEVLLRWHHPTKGLIPASEFIPIAEDTGQIHAIGLWVLQQACQQFQHWLQQGYPLNDIYLSVNLSGRQLREPDLIQVLDQILAATQISSHNLKLEVTETSLIQDIEMATPILEAIQARGIEISLDDFGTGFSSLRYLQQFPINTIKIDRSFTQTLNQGQRERSIIQAIISLAQALGFTTLAEGIETRSHFEQLKELGCDVGQGYWFSRPLSQEQLEQEIISRGVLAALPLHGAAVTS